MLVKGVRVQVPPQVNPCDEIGKHAVFRFQFLQVQVLSRVARCSLNGKALFFDISDIGSNLSSGLVVVV
jgi:hypothetical protein